MNDQYFNHTTIAKLDQQSFDELKVRWDLKSAMDSYYLDGKKDGEQEKAKQIAINLLKANIDTQLIIAATDLPIDVIEELKNTLGKN